MAEWQNQRGSIMESHSTRTNVNAGALNNGKQTKHSDIITILNKELREVTISDCQKNGGQAQGYKLCVRGNSSAIDTSNLPENIIHIIGEDIFVETKTLTDKQLHILLSESLSYETAMTNKNMIETIKEAILNGINKKSALVKVVRKNTGDYKKTIYNVLDSLEGKLWKVTSGPHNSKIYSLL
jgi:hypothetical protein